MVATRRFVHHAPAGRQFAFHDAYFEIAARTSRPGSSVYEGEPQDESIDTYILRAVDEEPWSGCAKGPLEASQVCRGPSSRTPERRWPSEASGCCSTTVNLTGNNTEER